jgi:hypothetical protein
MSQQVNTTLLWGLGILVLALFAAALFFPSPGATTFADQSAAFVVIAACAVGIERSMEFFWTLVDQARGTALGPIADAINTVTTNLSAAVKPVYDSAKAAVDQVAAANQWTDDQIKARKADIDRMESSLNSVLASTPNNTQLLAVATLTAKRYLDQLQQAYPTIADTANVATGVINDFEAFVATFQDNPGRRVIGLLVGSVLGLVVAYLFGFDLFKFVASKNSILEATHLGVAVTGLVIGLGANPTHEVIRAIQEYKNTQKSQ